MDLFVYGTLMVPKVMRTVCGYAQEGEPALLHDYCRRRVAGEIYPAIFARVGTAVGGILYRGVTTTQLTTLDSFEGPMYRRERVTVAVGLGAAPASTYVIVPGLRHALSDDEWSLEHFLADGLEAFLAGYPGFAGVSHSDRRRERP